MPSGNYLCRTADHPRGHVQPRALETAVLIDLHLWVLHHSHGLKSLEPGRRRKRPQSPSCRQQQIKNKSSTEARISRGHLRATATRLLSSFPLEGCKLVRLICRRTVHFLQAVLGSTQVVNWHKAMLQSVFRHDEVHVVTVDGTTKTAESLMLFPRKGGGSVSGDNARRGLDSDGPRHSTRRGRGWRVHRERLGIPVPVRLVRWVRQVPRCGPLQPRASATRQEGLAQPGVSARTAPSS